MYGTIFRMKVKPGEEDAVTQAFRNWEVKHRPQADGIVSSYVLKPDSANGEVIAVAIFKDESSFRANANRPGQDEWFQELRSHLQSDPEWIDGQFVYALPQ